MILLKRVALISHVTLCALVCVGGVAAAAVGQSEDVSTRIVNGQASANGAFPFAAALRTRRNAVVTFEGRTTTERQFFLGGSSIQSIEAETISCGLYADLNPLCNTGQAVGKICVLVFDYEVPGFLTDTPGQQLDRCASVGGIGAVFVRDIRGSTGITNVRDAQSDIPAFDATFIDSELFNAINDNIGSRLSIQTTTPATVFCTGSYLGNQWVLTAAHCIASSTFGEPGAINTSPSDMTVTIGVNDLDSQQGLTQTHRVESIYLNPDYRQDTSGTDRSDWALLRLATTPTTGAAVRIATRDELDAARARFDDVTLIGWGSRAGYGPGERVPSDLPSELHHAVVSAVDTDTCNAGFASFHASTGAPSSLRKVVSNEELCHGKRPTFDVDSCQGDSGGPVTLAVDGETKLVGVTSWGVGCAPEIPDLYAVSGAAPYFADTISTRVGFDVTTTAGTESVNPAGGSSNGGGGAFGSAFLTLLLLRLRRPGHPAGSIRS